MFVRFQNETSFFRQRSDDGQDVNRRSLNHNNRYIHFSPTIIFDTTATDYQLTLEELKFLNRGSTYVPPCQMSISSTSSPDDTLYRKFTPLRRRFIHLFSEYHVHLAGWMTFETKITKHFNDLFSTSIPTSIRERALYERQLIHSIRSQLKKNNLIVRRTADQNNIYY